MQSPSNLDFTKIADNVFALYGFVDPNGVLTEINGELLENLDFEYKSLIGQNFTESIIWQTDSENVSDIKEAFEKSKSGSPSKTSLKYRVNADETKYLNLNFVPTTDEQSSQSIYFFATDVSELHCQMQGFKDRCDHFLYAADIGEVGLWFWNLDNDEIYSTPKCNEIFDLDEDTELTYEYVLSIVHPDDLEKVKKKVAESEENSTEYSIQYRVIHSDGNIHWLWSHGKTVLNEQKTAQTMVGSVRIINDSKAASEELERIYNLEKKAKFEAERANKTKDFFLALVSHELRSPLNAILGWTNILLKKEVDDATRIKALETIEKSAKVQSKLIEDLVDSARVTSGKLKLELRPLNVNQLLQTVYNSHIPTMDEQHIEHEFNFDNEDVEIIGDTMRLRQVFSNLIGNAIKFTDQAGKISIDQISDAKNVTIIVKDTGQGIDEADQPYIFNRFAQGDDNYSKGSGGLGLGLSLAKILVENHKGTIDVKSDGIGFGSTFTVTLPLISEGKEVSKQPEKVTETKNDSGNKVLYKIKILVVEDDEDSRNVLEIYLSQIGAVVQTADSVREAFKILNKPESVFPDLIISDIGMPEEDGYSFMQKIRKSDEYKDIPAIALSAFTAEDNKRKAFDAGFQKYHTKPFEPDLLSEEIIELVNTRNEEDESE